MIEKNPVHIAAGFADAAVCLNGTPPRKQRISAADRAISYIADAEITYDRPGPVHEYNGRTIAAMGIFACSSVLSSLIERDKTDRFDVLETALEVMALSEVIADNADIDLMPATHLGYVAELGILNAMLIGIAEKELNWSYVIPTGGNSHLDSKSGLKNDVDFIVKSAKKRIHVQAKLSRSKEKTVYSDSIKVISAESLAKGKKVNDRRASGHHVKHSSVNTLLTWASQDDYTRRRGYQYLQERIQP